MIENPNVLILGQNSYIAKNFDNYTQIVNSRIKCDRKTLTNTEWDSYDFSKYSTILFAAGIAHVSTNPKMESLYFSINRDLTFSVAKKAKSEGVVHFIYLSSMIIYGDDLPLDSCSLITKETDPNPSNFYGKSKLEAEQLLLSLQDQKFKLSIIRLPMVYGPGCKGNFKKLLFVAKYSCFFPSIENQRSMIYIDNLSEFILQIINNNMYGFHYPQNTEYISTRELIKEVALVLNKKIILISFFNKMLMILSYKFILIRKIFGTRIYDLSMSCVGFDYNKVSFSESIRRCIEYKE